MTPLEQARRIVDYEARRDAQGHLKVYHLPAGDGGGEREVAGINDRYHPEVLNRIEGLLAAGKFQEAEDAAFNRGPTGAVRILQDALGLPADGIAGPRTKSALQEAEADPEKLLGDLRAARERYERRTRDESSPFWKGLSNRWDRQHEDSRSMLA